MEAKVEPRETYTKIDKKLHRAVARFEKDVGKITSKTPTKVSLKPKIFFCKLLNIDTKHFDSSNFYLISFG